MKKITPFSTSFFGPCYSFVEKLLFLLPNFHGVFRSMCLEVLVSQAALHQQLYQGLKDKGIHDMLTQSIVPEF